MQQHANFSVEQDLEKIGKGKIDPCQRLDGKGKPGTGVPADLLFFHLEILCG